MINKRIDISNLASDLNEIKTNLKGVSRGFLDLKIVNTYRGLKREYVDQELKSISIDMLPSVEKLNTEKSFKKKRLKTLYHIKDFLIDDYLSLSGISEEKAKAIYFDFARVEDSIYYNTPLKFDINNLSDNEWTIIKCLYTEKVVVEKVEEADQELTAITNEIGQDLTIARKKLPLIFEWFQKKEKKEQINAAISRLNQTLDLARVQQLKELSETIKSFEPVDDDVINDFIMNNAWYYAELEELEGPKDQVETYGLTSEVVEKVTDFNLNTEGLDVTLRGYQTFGAKYALTYKRTLLGDEMGLGKTIQAIAAINHLHQENKKIALVVCPLSVLTNWKREIQRFSNINVFVYHGKKRKKASLLDWQEKGGVMLTTYNLTEDLHNIENRNIDILIVDEAHYVKNPEAKRSKNVYSIAEDASYILFMSGTPLENKLNEMERLMGVLQPAIAADITKNMYFLDPYRYKEVISPVYLRRNRKDVLKELPELNITPVWTEFGSSELMNYFKAVEYESIHDMRRAAWTGNGPENSPKLRMLMELCDQAKENGDKVLIFSFYKNTLDKIWENLAGDVYGPITGKVNNKDRQTMIDRFSNAEAGSVLISQIAAGGIGLNIQAANTVIICEPQWKPSTEEQAISRAYRMGQAKSVNVYRLLTEDSIDENMLELLNQKSDLFDQYARDSNVGDLAKNVDESKLAAQAIKEEQKRLNVTVQV
ncbi:DEAD/DEAH box helicase [Salisediminibacterium halotolerans]|uniref:Superfamily II DNA or RNA helicase, SNF2 family n=1 Tax=Salisediminibacterium halotolerans TaxID=517425 RepID=A0A1H9T1I9_9BACI|nr:DEAD/DEAH box helicase [Salisediminibacterium haloalkalitolerans]SER90937.1 Superfamily II DNA or RNA helicase, SNF2 family [Salisediminibacterium haloalkalitolerans]